MGLLNNIKDAFNKADFTVAPNKKLKTISADFKKAFDLTLVFYKGAQIADGDLNWNNNLRIYRFSETLLNAAELILKTNGDAAKASDYLNRVHHRAGLADNLVATEDNILNERALEFVGEGKRYWDLVRTGRAASVLVPDQYGYRTNRWSENKKYLPIPQNEIDAAQGTLTQNNY